MFIGLDLGTTNIKALLVSPQGQVLARGAAPVPLYRRLDGAVEQEIEEIWQATETALRQVGSHPNAREVCALGVSSQGGAMQPLDAVGAPAGRVISWMDGRGAPYDRHLEQRLGLDWFPAHIGYGMSGISIGQCLRLRHEQPGLLDPPHRIGYVGDVIVSRLCGRPAHDATSLSIAMLYNPALRDADADLLRELGIEKSQLPSLLSPRESAGPLRAEVAREVSLPAGVPVSPAVHDQYAAALGAGVIEPSDMMFGAGTAWVLVAATNRLSPPVIPQALVCRHVVDGLYGQLLSMGNGGSSFKWALELIGRVRAPREEVDALLNSVPAGSDGLLFRPQLAPFHAAGMPATLRGGMDGLRLSHSPAHLLRAVLEGLGLELARYVALLNRGGIPVRRLAMCGGAAASAVTPQLIADAVGLPVSCAVEPEVSAFGAAVIARGLVEPGRSLAEVARSIPVEARLLNPGKNRATYQALFGRYLERLKAGAE